MCCYHCFATVTNTFLKVLIFSGEKKTFMKVSKTTELETWLYLLFRPPPLGSKEITNVNYVYPVPALYKSIFTHFVMKYGLSINLVVLFSFYNPSYFPVSRNCQRSHCRKVSKLRKQYISFLILPFFLVLGINFSQF